MNRTGCPHVPMDFSRWFLPPVLVLVFVVGVMANGWGLKSLLQKWKKLGNINVFVLNLGLADFLYLLTLPFLVVYYYKDKWIFGDTFCKVTRFCFNLNLYGTIGFLTCISVYRYLAIVHPMKVLGRISATHSALVSLLVWVLVALQSLPDMFFDKTYSKDKGCYETTRKMFVEDYLKYSLVWAVTGFFIPLLIVLGCYGHMIFTLCSADITDRLLKQRSLRLLLILILLFSVCYIPYHIFKNLNLWSRVLIKRGICHNWSNGVFIAHQIGRGLVCLNSALNPLVYLHTSRDVGAPLQRLLRRVCKGSTPTHNT